MWGDIAIAFLLGFITSFVITPYTIKLANKIGAIDLPKEERRINQKATPRLRRTCCNYWIFSFNDIFNYSYEHRRYNLPYRRGAIWV